jgi:hypothetical protein
MVRGAIKTFAKSRGRASAGASDLGLGPRFLVLAFALAGCSAIVRTGTRSPSLPSSAAPAWGAWQGKECR